MCDQINIFHKKKTIQKHLNKHFGHRLNNTNVKNQALAVKIVLKYVFCKPQNKEKIEFVEAV